MEPLENQLARPYDSIGNLIYFISYSLFNCTNQKCDAFSHAKLEFQQVEHIEVPCKSQLFGENDKDLKGYLINRKYHDRYVYT